MGRKHNQYGWFEGSPHSYQKLVEDYPEVQFFSQSYPKSSRSGYLYSLEYFLKINKLNPTEALKLTEEQAKKAIMKAVLKKQESGSYGSGRRIYYSVRRFFELHDKEIKFNRSQRKALMKWKPVKIAKQHIPSKLEIYRAVDSISKKTKVQPSRNKAIILCLWESGVRGSCLCSWKYGLVKDRLSEVPLTVKVVANRPKGVHDVGEDTKLSGYKLQHYFTFLGKEAVQALRDYIKARKKYDRWEPKDSDYLFTTAGTVSRGKQLNPKHLNSMIKTAFSQIGIAPDSVWTHVLRKAFRKTLYKSGIDPDISEALMGHKLGQSRTAYFDYNDKDFLREQYESVNWSRYPIKELETEVSKLQENGKSKDERIKELEQKLEYIKSPQYVKDLMSKITTESFVTSKPSRPVKTHQVKVALDDGTKLAEYMRKGYSPIYSDDKIWILEKEVEE